MCSFANTAVLDIPLEQIATLEERMRPGGDSYEGFLGPKESLLDCC